MVVATDSRQQTPDTDEDADLAFLRRRNAPDYAAGGGPALGVVDLFCGCGGMTLGLAEAARERGLRLDVRLAVDTDPVAVNAFNANFSGARCGSVEDFFDGELGTPPTLAEADLREAGKVHVLVGGPPCQGHSDLNNHTRRDDPRNRLYLRMVRAAEVLRPDVVLIENVATVVHDRGRVTEVAHSRLSQALGYTVAQGRVNMLAVGVPQARIRHVTLAVRGDLPDPSEVLARLEGKGPKRTVGWAIADLAGKSQETGFDAPGRPTPVNAARIDWLFDNDAHVLADHMRPPCHRHGNHTYNSIYGRMRWDEPAQTITTGFGSMGQGCFVHPRERRLITAREAARLQSFPDFFRFATDKRTKWAKMIGNAVPPFLTLHLGRLFLGAGLAAG